MKSFLILTNSIKDPELKVTKQIVSYIQANGGNAVIAVDDMQALAEGMDAIIVLGGDGTILRTASAYSAVDIPIVGVNLGTVGFLAEIDLANIEDMVKRLIADDYEIVDRMHLKSKLVRNGECIHEGNVLNDIVVSRAGYSKLICLKIYVNDQLLDIYEGDGAIVATPTGSTGYNLSAGGPIVSPNTDVIIVTPISPHSLTSKSIVFSSDDVIRIEVINKRPDIKIEPYINFDGNCGMELECGDCIIIKKSSKRTKLVKLYKVSFFEVLRNKISD